MSFTGFAVRLDEDLPLLTWGQIALTAGQMAVIAARPCWRWVKGASARNATRQGGIALTVAWLATAPLILLMLVTPI